MRQFSRSFIAFLVLTLSSSFAFARAFDSVWRQPEIFLGYGYFNYAEINQQFKTFHKISGIGNVPLVGARWRGSRSVFLIENALFGTFSQTNKMAGNFLRKFSAWNIQDNFKLNYPLFERSGNLIAPFAGVTLNYLKIQTQFNYAIKCPDCFFQYRRNYTGLSAGLLYGISFEHIFAGSGQVWRHLGFGLDVGGVFPFWDKEWRINGEKIGDKELAPAALFKNFVAFQVIIR